MRLKMLFAAALLAITGLAAEGPCTRAELEETGDRAGDAASDALTAIAKSLDGDPKDYFFPVGGTVTEGPWGPGDGDHATRDLHAIDFFSDKSAVYPTRPGIIAYADYDCSIAAASNATQKTCYGNTVAVDHGDGTYSIYTHLAEKPSLAVGAPVTRRTKLGDRGDSGCNGVKTCTAHLHFVVRQGARAGISGRDVLFGKADTPVDVRGKLKSR